MRDFAAMEEAFDQYETGKARLGAIRSAIEEADAAQDVYWQFGFRYDFVRESIFSGDRYHGLIRFPEMLRFYREHPELSGSSRASYDMLICFRWIVEAVTEFPQISRADVESYFRSLKEMLLEQGKSLGCYYMKRGYFYMRIDRDLEAANYYRFLDAPFDDSSDGRPLCCNHRVMHLLYTGNEEAALREAEPIFSGRLRAYCLPHATQHKFVRFYLSRGEYEKAETYAHMLEPRADGDPFELNMVGTLLSLWSVRDPQHGLALFARNRRFYDASENPWQRLLFATGAGHLLSRCGPKAQGVLLPHETAGTLARQFLDEAARIAGQFEERDGTDDYMRGVRFEEFVQV